jgi:hypothetical protein
LSLSFREAFFMISALFPRFRETLYAGRVKHSAEAPELFWHAVFQLVVVVRKTASSECILQGAKRWKSEGPKSGMYGAVSI